MYNIPERTLWRYISKFLSTKPRAEKQKIIKDVYIKVNAKYFGRWGCLIVFKSGHKLLYWCFVDRETYNNYIIAFHKVKSLNCNILGVISDWHGSLVSVVKELYPDIPHQRCLVHTQRRCEQLLTKNPQTEAGVRLLEIVKELNQVKTHQESKVWIAWLKRWEEEFKGLVKQRSYGKTDDGQVTWWYTHKNLRATYRTLITTLDSLFLYLDDPKLDKDTNGIESEFSHLKQKINMHRGLTKDRKIAVIFWYLKFKNEERS